MVQTPPIGKLDTQIQLYRAALNAYRQNVERRCVRKRRPMSTYRLLDEQAREAIAESDMVLADSKKLRSHHK